MQDDPSTIEKVIGWGVLAGMGGAVKYVSIVLKSTERIVIRRFLALSIGNTFVSSFCGIIGGLFVSAMDWSRTWQFAAAGIIGYLGPQGLDIIILSVKKKIDPSADTIGK